MRGGSPRGRRKKKRGCSGRCSAASGARKRREVLFFKYDAVMKRMAGNDERNREYGDFLAAGGAAAEPGGVIEGADERDGAAADGREFLQQIGELAGRGV